jgi:hypothetical protein
VSIYRKSEHSDVWHGASLIHFKNKEFFAVNVSNT